MRRAEIAGLRIGDLDLDLQVAHMVGKGRKARACACGASGPIVAERWVRSARRECLDYLLILGERQLHRTLATYVQFYNQRRSHPALSQQCPIPRAPAAGCGPVVRRDGLGGLLHDYSRAAA